MTEIKTKTCNLELHTGLLIIIDLKLNNQLISLVLLNNLEQLPLEPQTLESFTIGCNPMQNSTTHSTIKLSPTVQAALKPHQVPSPSKEDLWQLLKKSVLTLICKTFLLWQCSTAPGFTGGLQCTLSWFYIFMFITPHYEDGKWRCTQIRDLKGVTKGIMKW